MSDTRCQAAALDGEATLGSSTARADAVPPCDGLGEIERAGYLLCAPCAEALDGFLALGTSLLGRDAFGGA